MKNYVYRFKNEKQEVIYIGKTIDLDGRIRKHKHLDNKCYEEIKTVEYITLNTVDDMDLAERYLIAKYKPKYNTVYKYTYITLTINDLDNMVWTELKNHKFIEDKGGLITDKFEGDVVTCTFKLYDPIQKDFLEFCKRNNKYKVQDILSQFIKEGLEKYK